MNVHNMRVNSLCLRSVFRWWVSRKSGHMPVRCREALVFGIALAGAILYGLLQMWTLYFP